MKNKKIICLLLVFLMMILAFNINSYAITSPELIITSNNYSEGDKMQHDDVKNVEVEKTLQLYAVIAYGNDLLFDDDYDSLGWFVDEANLSGVTWTSSDDGIATVDNTGKVTGVAEGQTTITATYNEETANYEINVKPKSDIENTGVWVGRYEPEPAKILNKDYEFMIYLYNIPDTEKENIQVTIENENIAKLIGIDLDGAGTGMVIANAKLLALGSTKITATLNYNGKTYSDTFEFSVVESAYTLTISAKDYTNLPSSIEVGNKIQLTVMLNIYGGSLLPEDVTDKGVTYTSSNERVATVNNKGLITAIGEGTTTITAKYKVEDETITSTYNLKITDSTKSPANPNENNTDSPTDKGDTTTSKNILPKTGDDITIMIIGIVLVILISIITYKKYKNYKDIK